MGDIEAKKELEGISGWLVLFQIYIILVVCEAFQNILLVFFTGKTMQHEMFLPYYVLFNVSLLLISLVCMILFYKRQIAFRRLFIFHGIVYIIFLVLYGLFGTEPIYFNSYSGVVSTYEIITKVVRVERLIVIIGIYTAFIIALYRSKRVKNTFR